MQGQPAFVEEGTVPCKEASEALTLSIFSLFCFGIILGPMAISKASKAKKMIALNPTLSGSGKATAAMVIGTVALLLWLVSIASRASHLGQR